MGQSFVPVLGALALLLAACPSGGQDPPPSSAATSAADEIAPPMPELARITTSFGAPLPTTPGEHRMVATTREEDGRTTDRTFTVHVPSGQGPFPVILSLHPFGSSGDRFEADTGLAEAGTRRGAVVIVPDATGPAWNASLTCCQPAVSEGRPDAAFVLDLLDLVGAGLPLDPDRIGATGFSNGGYLSYRLACTRSDLVRRVAVVGATMDLPCQPRHPVSVLHLHGTDDGIIPLVDDRAPFSPQAEGRSARHVTDFWARVAGCKVPTAGADELDEDITYAACEAGLDVELDVLPGVGHLWPEGATERVLDFLLAG